MVVCHYRHKLAKPPIISWPDLASFRVARSPNLRIPRKSWPRVPLSKQNLSMGAVSLFAASPIGRETPTGTAYRRQIPSKGANRPYSATSTCATCHMGATGNQPVPQDAHSCIHKRAASRIRHIRDLATLQLSGSQNLAVRVLVRDAVLCRASDIELRDGDRMLMGRWCFVNNSN